jgi:uncharacterized protein with HEPN domain
MTPEREYTDYLRDMLDATDKALRFVGRRDLEAFHANEEKVFAVVRALEIIGEAAKQVPEGLRARYPRIPWKDVAGIRDKLIHHYFGVDVEVVWRTVRHDLPGLRTEISRVLRDVEDHGVQR